jgi:hypothetical protein
MTGVNIPDMIKIVEEHGLIAVPVDLNLDTVSPNNFDDIKRLTTDKVCHIETPKIVDQSNHVCLPLRYRLRHLTHPSLP